VSFSACSVATPSRNGSRSGSRSRRRFIDGMLPDSSRASNATDAAAERYEHPKASRRSSAPPPSTTAGGAHAAAARCQATAAAAGHGRSPRPAPRSAGPAAPPPEPGRCTAGLTGALDGVGVRLHEFGVPGCAADDGVDQVVQLLDQPAAHCAFVGDSVTDIEVSHLTGIRSIGLLKTHAVATKSPPPEPTPSCANSPTSPTRSTFRPTHAQGRESRPPAGRIPSVPTLRC